MGNTTRPVHLDLTTIRFPVTAIASILHRISGVVLFIGVTVLVFWLRHSLASEQGFTEAVAFAEQPLGWLLLWGISSAACYHLILGIRHLIMDLGYWETLPSASISAWISFALTLLCVLLLGVWLW